MGYDTKKRLVGKGDRKKLMNVEEEQYEGGRPHGKQLVKAGQRALDNMDSSISAIELFKKPHRFGAGDAYVPPKRKAIQNKPAPRKGGGYRRKF